MDGMKYVGVNHIRNELQDILTVNKCLCVSCSDDVVF